MSRPEWLTNLLSIECTSLSNATSAEKTAFLDVFQQLGEPLLLALDGIDNEKYSRIVPASEYFDSWHDGKDVSIDSIKGSSGPIYLAYSGNGRYYEVRLRAWNCPCAQFVCGMHTTSEKSDLAVMVQSRNKAEYCWGGVHARHGSTIHFCKHLIAASLLEYGGPVFSKHCKFETVENFDFTL